MIIWMLFAIVVILQGFDIYSTAQALKKPGNREGNRVVAWAMNMMGAVPALITIKGLFCGGLAAAVFFFPSIWLAIVMATIAAVYAAIVINNFRRR